MVTIDAIKSRRYVMIGEGESLGGAPVTQALCRPRSVPMDLLLKRGSGPTLACAYRLTYGLLFRAGSRNHKTVRWLPLNRQGQIGSQRQRAYTNAESQIWVWIRCQNPWAVAPACAAVNRKNWGRGKCTGWL